MNNFGCPCIPENRRAKWGASFNRDNKEVSPVVYCGLCGQVFREEKAAS